MRGHGPTPDPPPGNHRNPHGCGENGGNPLVSRASKRPERKKDEHGEPCAPENSGFDLLLSRAHGQNGMSSVGAGALWSPTPVGAADSSRPSSWIASSAFASDAGTGLTKFTK